MNGDPMRAVLTAVHLCPLPNAAFQITAFGDDGPIFTDLLSWETVKMLACGPVNRAVTVLCKTICAFNASEYKHLINVEFEG